VCAAGDEDSSTVRLAIFNRGSTWTGGGIFLSPPQTTIESWTGSGAKGGSDERRREL
jgi:hypothetical protein